MVNSKQNYSNKCSICGEKFSSFGEYLNHFKSDHDEAPWRDKSTLKKLYIEEEKSTNEIADCLGCAQTTIIKWLEKFNIERRSTSESKTGAKYGDYGVTEEQKSKLNNKDWLVQNYVEAGNSMTKLAEKIDSNKDTVANALEYYGIEIRSCHWEGYTPEPGENSNLPELYDEKWVRKEYIENDRTLEDIAEELGCSIAPVSYAVSRFDITKYTNDVPSGENHPQWTDRDVRYGAKWEEKRIQRIKHDDEECVVCGIDKQSHKEKYGVSLHVHHIQPVRSFEDTEDAHEISNLVTLCASCHGHWEGIPLRPQS